MTNAIALPMPISVSLEAETPPSDWLTRFVDDIPTGIALFDRELRYVAANPYWVHAFRLAAAVLAGQRHDELHPDADPQFADLLRRALAGEVVTGCDGIGSDAAGRLWRRAVSFRPRRARDGSILGVIAALQEVASAGADNPADEAADRLTGIASRESFLARVRAALASSRASERGCAMFLVDLSNFKGVNDLYGSRVGDCVLRTIASRLLAAIRSKTSPSRSRGHPAGGRRTDLVARLGADEFGVILERGSAAPHPDGVARRLLQLVSDPVAVGDRRLRITANVGYLVSGPAHRSEDDVLRDLNVALQEAKMRGPNNAQGWEPALSRRVGRRLALLDDLRRAFEEREFTMHYQPVISLADDRVVGAEALLRWNHPHEGLIPAKDFLPAIEDSSLIVPVGCWVIREVVRQMQVWEMLYGRDIVRWVSINVSARQFDDPSLLLKTLREIHEKGFSLDRLKLEITESAVMRSPETTRGVLRELRQIGVTIALDDFGTGYSGLGALRDYAVDTIKIAPDFTSRLDTVDGRELVLALLKIARIYGASVVAEGVETAFQQTVLRGADCDFGQGHLFATAMGGSFFGAYTLTHLVGGTGTDAAPLDCQPAQ